MHLQGFWHEFAAQQGNAPGAQQGDVVVTLVNPVGGESEFTVPSNDVSIAAEAGNILGVQVVLGDGRRLFLLSGNVAGIIDAPLKEADQGKRSDGRPATGGVRPEEGVGVFPQDRTDAERGQDEARADAVAHAEGSDQPHKSPRARGARAGEAAAAHDKAEAAHDKSEAAEDKAQAEKRAPGR